MKEIILTKCPGNITLTLDETGGASIESILKENCPYCSQLYCEDGCKGKEDEDDYISRLEYNSCIDGIESMIMSLASKGIDVESDAVQEAISDSLQAAANNT